MNPTNEQELREQINAIRERLVGRNQTHQQVARLSKWTRIELENVIKEDSWIYEDEMIALIQAHTNAEIAKAVKEAKPFPVGGSEFADGYMAGIKQYETNLMKFIERAKLKEVK